MDSSLKPEEFTLPQSVEQIQRRRKQITDLTSWLQTFTIYMEAMASADATSKKEMAGLLAHSFLITQLSKNLQGIQWLQYDKEFRVWAIYGRCLTVCNASQPSNYTDERLRGLLTERSKKHVSNGALGSAQGMTVFLSIGATTATRHMLPQTAQKPLKSLIMMSIIGTHVTVNSNFQCIITLLS